MTEVGLRHLGIDASDGIVVTDADLRAKTRLMAYISGDVKGPITVGQVRRIQAGNLDPETPTGNITAHVTSVGSDIPAEIGAGEGAMGYIIAGNSISGTIKAAVPTTGASRIDRVQVGPNTAAAGISGDIIAEAGSIHTIFSTGPIGNGEVDPEDYLEITAANGIGQVRTIQQSGGDVLLARDVEANVTANKAMLDNPSTFGYTTPTNDGALGTLEVGGDLRGEVKAGNLVCTVGSCAVEGIFVHGVCYAPITVDLTLVKAAIVAQTFTEPIVIGHNTDSMIVATGGSSVFGVADGHIPSIIVGHGESPGREAFYYAAQTPGLIGASFSRTIPTPAEDWFASGTSIDAVIHAEDSIGEALVTSLSGGGCLKYPPAVESPVIEVLDIDSLAFGVVWSGQFDDEDDDVSYAVIDEFSVGCVRQTGTVWMKNWTSATVKTDLFGDIHVPEIKDVQVLTVGRIFGYEGAVIAEDTPVAQACECTALALGACQECDWVWNYLHEVLTVNNPRNPWWPAYLPDGGDSGDRPDPDRRGQIWIHETEGLEGQIIINASYSTTISPSLLWSGAVQVGIGTNGYPLIEVSPTPSSGEWESPHYDGLPAALGGGAIGLVPFALHRTACDPPADADLEDYRTFTSSEFAGLLEPGIERRVVTLAFYGWVGANHTTHHPVTAYNGEYTTERGKWMDIDIDQDGSDPRSREVTVTGNGVQYLLPGVYAIEPVTTSSEPDELTPMVCIGTFGTGGSAPLVADFTYEFALTPDCDGNGEDDGAQIESDPTLDLWPMDGLLDYCYWSVCDGDVNCDLALDGFDVEVQEQAIGGNLADYCSERDPDFNRDQAVDGFDVEAVEFAVGNGFCNF